MKHPESKFTVVGGGILGAMEAYYYLRDNPGAKVVVNEASPDGDTTVKHLVPSLTAGEMLAVVKFETLEKDLYKKFTEGGLHVDDVEGVNDSDIAKRFIEQAKAYTDSGINHQTSMNLLFEFGQEGMKLWQDFYDNANDKLKQILHDSYFNPFKESDGEVKYGGGYRPYLMIRCTDAENRAVNVIEKHKVKGYKNSKFLSPDELIELDSSLKNFVHDHSYLDEKKNRVWNDDARCVWLPGGCIHMPTFLPKFYKYLEQMAGTYVNNKSETKNCFRVKNGRKVTGVELEGNEVTGIKINDERTKKNKHKYKKSEYVFCPGKAVGTLDKMGFKEPASSGFAGASLVLKIPATKELRAKYSQLKNQLDIAYDPVGCVWQAKLEGDYFIIGIGGTKAFYGAEEPNNNQEFARNRHLLQLNIINKILPDFFKEALGRDTRRQELTEADLLKLVENKIVERWVGLRAVACDGMPTVDNAYAKDGTKIINTFVDTHAGSGGNAYAHALAELSSRIRSDRLEGNWQKYAEMTRSDREYQARR